MTVPECPARFNHSRDPEQAKEVYLVGHAGGDHHHHLYLQQHHHQQKRHHQNQQRLLWLFLWFVAANTLTCAAAGEDWASSAVLASFNPHFSFGISLAQVGPNHLASRLNALLHHSMALITSEFRSHRTRSPA